MQVSEVNKVEIHLAHTQGFCAGVAYALDIVDLALEKYGTPLYVRHQIVHNTAIVRDYESKGVIFIEELSEVPENSNVIFSAHGVAPTVYEEAQDRGLNFVDATCPLVTKVHKHAVSFTKNDVQTILIGHRGHQELVGTSGYVRDDLLHIVEDASDIEALDIDASRPVGYLTQTTLSVSETSSLIGLLREKYPHIQGAPKSEICYATQNRQDAVTELARFCDVVIICGSPNSSNSNRLRETAADLGIDSYIVDTADEVELNWVEGKYRIGISSGASVPRFIVDAVVNRIQGRYPDATVHQKDSIEDGIYFKPPVFS